MRRRCRKVEVLRGSCFLRRSSREEEGSKKVVNKTSQSVVVGEAKVKLVSGWSNTDKPGRPVRAKGRNV